MYKLKTKTSFAFQQVVQLRLQANAQLFMATLWNRAGHYIFALWFLSFCLSFFSSPNLSDRRLDVYHTPTRGVTLVQI